jgi:hypothetical protein
VTLHLLALLAAFILLFNFALVVCIAWAQLMVWFADSSCTCRKGAWDPECPRHGRRVA